MRNLLLIGGFSWGLLLVIGLFLGLMMVQTATAQSSRPPATFTDPAESALEGDTPTTDYFQAMQSVDLLAEVLKIIHGRYVEPVDAIPLMETGIQAMLGTLDPYTVYVSAKQAQDYQRWNIAAFQNIGVELIAAQAGLVVHKVDPNSDAQVQGVEIGDVLLEINGINLQGKDRLAIESLLKGQVDTQVRLQVRRGTVLHYFEIVRKEAAATNIAHFAILRDGVGYVRVKQFGERVADELRQAIDSLQTLGATQLILDLRGNPGGLLDQALTITNYFLPEKSLLLSTQGRNTDLEQDYYAQYAPLYPKMRLAVLLGPRSASASEIVAGAIQDHDRGIMLGQTSFGKGLVQRVVPLSYGSQVKFTVARYHTPSGRCIQATNYAGIANKDSTQVFFTAQRRPVYSQGGITPDVLIDQDTPLKALLGPTPYLFDFATAYYRANPSLLAEYGSPAFEQRTWEALLLWLKEQDAYDKAPTMQGLDALEKQLPHAEQAAQPLATVRAALRAHLQSQLIEARAGVLRALSFELLRRYNTNEKARNQALLQDPTVDQAITHLLDEASYQSLLQPPK